MSIVIPAGSSGFGYNAQEMIDFVAEIVRNVSISAKILRWLNMAITETSTDFVFGHLHKYAAKATAPNIPDLILENDVLWLKSAQIPSQNRKLYPLPGGEAQWAEQEPTYRTLTGTTTHYYLNGIVMGLVQVPSGIHMVEYSYQRRSTKLVSGSDICDLPPEWHMYINWKAVGIGATYEGNERLIITAKAEQKEVLKKLGTNVYRRPDQTTVLGPKARVGKPAHPRLPSNYPRGS